MMNPDMTIAADGELVDMDMDVLNERADEAREATIERMEYDAEEGVLEDIFGR